MMSFNLKAGRIGLALCAALAVSAQAGEPAPAKPEMHSVEEADRVLAEASAERARIEREFAAEREACVGKFFATSCTDKAKEKRHEALTRLRPAEVEAGLVKRRANVAEKDRALAEKREKDEAAAAAAAATPPDEKAVHRAEMAARGPAAPKVDAQTEAAKIAESQRRQAEHQAKLERLKRSDAAAAQKEAENIAAYNRKVAEAHAHQKEVEKRKAEKAADLARQKEQKEKEQKARP